LSPTVFIQKGAKAKFKKRMADPVKVKAKVKKVARLTGQNTRPVSHALIDCPPFINERETQTSLRDTNVSPKESFVTKTHSATPPAFIVKQPSNKVAILDLVPELKSLLVTVLAQNGCKGKIQWVSNFIEFTLQEASFVATARDRQDLAEGLLTTLPLYFIAVKARRRNMLTSLFAFLREYMGNFIPVDFYRSDEFNKWNMGPGYTQMDKKDEFFRKYPFCNPEKPSERTGVNRGWGF
jgi:hypothetical protein